jgi:hypothetical protein
MLPLRHHHPNTAVKVAVVAATTSAAISPLLRNNCLNNDHMAAMWLAISLAMQVADMQQCQWGGWATGEARGGDDNGNNGDHSVAAATLAEYPH